MSRRQLERYFLVGAGPGAPGLVTLRGVQCLGRADVVLYDYLVNPRILPTCPGPRPSASVWDAMADRDLWSQAEIDAAIVGMALAQARPSYDSKVAIRRFLLAGPKRSRCSARHGIEFEIVPGITAALAAGSYAGVPITHRDCASAVAIVTGQEADDKAGLTLDYGHWLTFRVRLVVYMGVTTAPQWTAALWQAGMPPIHRR